MATDDKKEPKTTYYLRRSLVLVIALVIVILITSSSIQASSPMLSKNYCHDVIEAMVSLLSGLRLPKYLIDKNARKTSDEFDVNRYFSVLNHLSLAPGLSLDYVYYFDGMGGEPILYVRPSDQESYQTYAEYKAANKTFSRDKFMDGIRADDTPEGFFQLIVLRVMGILFYRYWHALNYDHQIVCSEERLDKILSRPTPLPSEVQKQARNLDLAPTVVIDTDTVRVQVIIFTNWGGFLRQTYVLNRPYPHTLIEERKEVLIPYDCGTRF